ncbi:MAG: hypothetical protein M1828_005265 [Chrysothrix sp. TS-e1954]|nr:MAG: hypothetical protein M1828_005265 [Chrysothrix sp. TS-e1954]
MDPDPPPNNHPQYQQQPSPNPQNQQRPYTSYSDTGFRPYSSQSDSQMPSYQQQYQPPYTPPLDGHSGNNTPTLAGSQFPQQQQQTYPSRPASGLSNSTDPQNPTRHHRSDSLQQQQQQQHHQQQQYSQQQQQQQSQSNSPSQKAQSVVIKVGMVGDAQIGKTSLMVKYVEGSWDEDYIQTLGVNFMEKTVMIRGTEVTFSIWDLGGQREFVNMLPLVCNDAVAILFMFDLTRKSTLNSIKEWYRQGRGFNKTAIPFLVGTKYDHFVNFPREEQEEISLQAKRFARAMKASLIFSSTSHSINVQKIFKIVLSKSFDLKCTVPEIENVGEPLLLYQSVG